MISFSLQHTFGRWRCSAGGWRRIRGWSAGTTCAWPTRRSRWTGSARRRVTGSLGWPASSFQCRRCGRGATSIVCSTWSWDGRTSLVLGSCGWRRRTPPPHRPFITALSSEWRFFFIGLCVYFIDHFQFSYAVPRRSHQGRDHSLHRRHRSRSSCGDRRHREPLRALHQWTFRRPQDRRRCPEWPVFLVSRSFWFWCRIILPFFSSLWVVWLEWWVCGGGRDLMLLSFSFFVG